MRSGFVLGEQVGSKSIKVVSCDKGGIIGRGLFDRRVPKVFSSDGRGAAIPLAGFFFIFLADLARSISDLVGLVEKGSLSGLPFESKLRRVSVGEDPGLV